MAAIIRRQWRYECENVGGNFHKAVEWINANHPEWDVVAMDMTGYTTIVVHRVELSTVEAKES